MSIDSFHMLECHYQWPPLRGWDNGHIYTAAEPLREGGGGGGGTYRILDFYFLNLQKKYG